MNNDQPPTGSDEVAAYLEVGRAAGCPNDQLMNFLNAGIVLQPRQLAASAAARLCDDGYGPTEIGYGGARGGGKSHWLLAQIGADDCQRMSGLKCLLLRKVGKANLEHFEDLRRALFSLLPHEFSASRGILTFSNGSRIIAGHFQSESDIDSYLGLEYDVLGVEEATTLSRRKYEHILTCCRSSKRHTSGLRWRPRIYSTTNPGGIGHTWYRARFIDPHLRSLQPPSPGGAASARPQPSTINHQPSTVFIPARVTDNAFNNPEYKQVLERLHGWQRRAWLDGDWDIQAGQFFTTFRREVHVVHDPPPPTLNPQPSTLNCCAINHQPSTINHFPTLNYFDESRAREWWAALDYGFTHYTVFLLGCKDGDGNTFIVDEHAERLWLPERHAAAIKSILSRHGLLGRARSPSGPDDHQPSTINHQPRLSRIVAGADVFSRQSDGSTVAKQYARLGINLRPANMDRINGWAEILSRLGDPTNGIPPRLFIHARCARLIDTLPTLQHDPNRPEDILKVDADEEGQGGDDTADALRYLLATKPQTIGCAVA